MFGKRDTPETAAERRHRENIQAILSKPDQDNCKHSNIYVRGVNIFCDDCSIVISTR